jgi:hypothetical protein
MRYRLLHVLCGQDKLATWKTGLVTHDSLAIDEVEVFGRGERIRTSDLSVPNRAHYQAVLRPEFCVFKNYLRRRCILRVARESVKQRCLLLAKTIALPQLPWHDD